MVPASGIWLEVIFGTKPKLLGQVKVSSGALTSQYRACCGWCLRYGACCPHPTLVKGPHLPGSLGHIHEGWSRLRAAPASGRTQLPRNHLSLSSWDARSRGSFQPGQHIIVMPPGWLLQLSITIVLFLWASHRARLGLSYLASSQKHLISWKKTLELRQGKWFFQICQEVQSVGSNAGLGLWSPVSFPWLLLSPFYFVVENSGRGRKVWSLERQLTGKLCKFSCDGFSCLGKPF